jgi:glycosyltransferase involved in cell wall biosynthesis
MKPIDEPLVSVIIPSYNHGHFIGKAIQSVLDQTYENIEVLVVDNHSADDTRQVVEGFHTKLDIRFLEISNHGVIAASRNKGISEATGEWIAFLDSDDSWMPDKLEKVVNAAYSDCGYDVICHNEMRVYENSSERQELMYGPYCENFYRTLLTEGNCLSTSATIVRHEFLKEHSLQFNESVDFITVEDYALWLDLAYAGARFKFIEGFLGEYFIHAGNNSASLQRHWINGEKLVYYHLYKVQKFTNTPNKAWSIYLAKNRLSQLKQSISANQYRLACKVIGKIVFEYPHVIFIYLLKRAISRLLVDKLA